MFNQSKLKVKNDTHSNKWRDYQSKLKKKDATRRSYRRIPFYAVLLCSLIIGGNFIFTLLDKSLEVKQKNISLIFPNNQKETFDKNTLQRIVRHFSFATRSDKNFELTTGGKTDQIK